MPAAHFIAAPPRGHRRREWVGVAAFLRGGASSRSRKALLGYRVAVCARHFKRESHNSHGILRPCRYYTWNSGICAILLRLQKSYILAERLRGWVWPNRP